MRNYILWAPLVNLSSEQATFRNDQTGVAFVIPTQIWISLNRPGHLSIPLTEPNNHI